MKNSRFEGRKDRIHKAALAFVAFEAYFTNQLVKFMPDSGMLLHGDEMEQRGPECR
jgi:hypothetical protein